MTLSLLVHARKGTGNLGDYTFSVEAIKQRGRWLVNRIYTIAINHPVRGNQREIGPADFQAPSGSNGPTSTKPRLGSSWLLPIVAILCIALVVPLAIGGFLFVRTRRRRRRLIEQGRGELPPLPSSFRSP